jgi:hypothetical protein
MDSAPPGDIWRQNVQKCGPLVLHTQMRNLIAESCWLGKIKN